MELVRSEAILGGMKFYIRNPFFAASEKVVHSSVKAEKNKDVALHASVEKSNVKSVKALIHAGADVNALYSEIAPLHRAVDNGNVEVVKVLITAGANANAIDNNNITPLHIAADDENVEIIKVLINTDANVNVIDNTVQFTPLHFAARNKNVAIINALIKAGANVNAINYSHRTPLHLAAANSRVEVVKILLTTGANVNAIDYKKTTPLHLAVRENNLEVIKVLTKAGANVKEIDFCNYRPLRMLATLGVIHPRQAIMIKFHLLSCFSLYRGRLNSFSNYCSGISKSHAEFAEACEKQVIRMSQDLVADRVSLLNHLNRTNAGYKMQDNINASNRISDMIFQKVLAMEYPLYSDVLCEHLGRSYFTEKFANFNLCVTIQTPESALKREITLDMFSMIAIAKYLPLFDLANFVLAFTVPEV